MARPSNLATAADLARLVGADRPVRRRAQPERHFTDRVKRYARRGGWLSYHNLHAKGSDPGFLDLLLIRVPRLVLAELKIPPNDTTEWQDAWIETWKTLAMLSGPHLRIETYIWVPEQWPEIERVLA